jgi:hypothetical protein
VWRHAAGIKGSQHLTIRHRDRIYVEDGLAYEYQRGIAGQFHKVSTPAALSE